MKTLLIIRHAQAKSAFSLNDFERSLTERGKKDAIEMASRVLKLGISIDAFISSPAKRASNTCELFCIAYKQNKQSIVFLDSLYHASKEVFYEVVESLDDDLHTVALFSHNPGITLFVNSLTDQKINNMPPCGVFAVTINNITWKGFLKARKDFLFFDFP